MDLHKEYSTFVKMFGERINTLENLKETTCIEGIELLKEFTSVQYVVMEEVSFCWDKCFDEYMDYIDWANERGIKIIAVSFGIYYGDEYKIQQLLKRFPNVLCSSSEQISQITNAHLFLERNEAVLLDESRTQLTKIECKFSADELMKY